MSAAYVLVKPTRNGQKSKPGRLGRSRRFAKAQGRNRLKEARTRDAADDTKAARTMTQLECSRREVGSSVELPCVGMACARDGSQREKTQKMGTARGLGIPSRTALYTTRGQ